MDEETFSVINNLVSTSSTDALSALQGKVLKGMIDELNSNMEAINLNNLVQTDGDTLILVCGSSVI